MAEFPGSERDAERASKGQVVVLLGRWSDGSDKAGNVSDREQLSATSWGKT